MARELDKSMEDDKRFIFDQLDSVDVESIKSEGLTIRAGNKLLKFEIVSDGVISVEDEIRDEFKSKLHDKIQVIREKVNSKIQEMSLFIQEKKREYDRKEHELKESLKMATPMPNVTFSLAQKGLSVVKGRDKDELIWLVQGIYWPKKVDQEPINGKFSKKMLSNVIYMIKTRKDKIVEVSTRQPVGLDFFHHYHQSPPDCWGKWNPIRKWEKPEDIIAVAREAEAVLENINVLSIANHNPRGLPRKDTVLKHVLKKKSEMILDTIGPLSQDIRRSGISVSTRSEEDMWTT